MSFLYYSSDVCPVTGLPIILRPEWTFFSQDKTYRARITQVGEQIFIYQPSGKPQAGEVERTVDHILGVIDSISYKGEKFYFLFDYSELVAPPLKNRLATIRNLKNLVSKIELVVFFGMRGPVRAMVKMAMLLTSMSDKMFICRNYHEALSTVQSNKEFGGLRSSFTGGMKEETSELLRMLARVVWDKEYHQQAEEAQQYPPGSDMQQIAEAVDVLRRDLYDLQQENERKQKSLELANRVKDDFIANMSHEMRTPLNGILGTVQLLRLGGNEQQKQHYMHVLQESASSLLARVNEMLELASLDKGNVEIQSKALDIHSLAEGVIGMFASAADQDGLLLLLDIKPGVPRILLADQDRLRQILVNIVGNAVKYTTNGWVILEIQYRDENVMMRVMDTGPGIPDELKEAIFSRFVRAEREDAPSGTGLGLSIGRELAELLGGRLQLDHTSIEGSTFSLHIPAKSLERNEDLKVPIFPDGKVLWQCRADEPVLGKALERMAHCRSEAEVNVCPDNEKQSLPVLVVRDGGVHMILPGGEMKKAVNPISRPMLIQLAGYTAVSRVESASDSVSASFGGRVLVVDDNAVNRLVACGFLRALGIETQEAENGYTAIDSLENESFDLVLMDCNMPGLGGCAASRIIRRDMEHLNHMPIVAVTAYSSREKAAEVKNSGMQAMLEKPLRLEALQDMLNTLFPDKKVRHVSSKEYQEIVAENDYLEAVHARMNQIEQEDFVQIQIAIDDGDWKRLARIVHSLYGVLSQFGGSAPAAVCREIEQASFLPNPGKTLTQLAKRLEAEYFRWRPNADFALEGELS
jgi:signal transduction histidine kinase/DNA-binding response OmpR family regulator